MTQPLIDIQSLSVSIPFRSRLDKSAVVRANSDISLSVHPGEVHAVVGESGCGKSIIAQAVVGTLPTHARMTGRVCVQEAAEDPAWSLDMVDFHSTRRGRWNDPISPLAGTHVGMVAQSAATYLTPVRRVGSQLQETINRIGSELTAAQLLDRAHVSSRVLDMYPHELSGGMAQRVAIAFALAGNPEIIVADEPTASLDPELKSSMFSLLRELADDNCGVLLITHDFSELFSAECADSLSVMHASRIVESGPARRVFQQPSHSYSRALWAALPENGMVPIPGLPPSLIAHHDGSGSSLTFEDRAAGTSSGTSSGTRSTSPSGAHPSRWKRTADQSHPPALWEGRRLAHSFGAPRHGHELFHDVDLSVHAGEIVGLSGPSGSGKTTLAKIMCGLITPQSGDVLCDGEPVRPVLRHRGHPIIGQGQFRSGASGRINMLFQSPRKACNPRLTLQQIINEQARVMSAAEAAREVGLTDDLLERRPSEVSDGQLQRAVLARTLASDPQFLICDEVTAMLDPGTAAHTVCVLREWAKTRGIGVIIISHSPELLRSTCDRLIALDSPGAGSDLAAQCCSQPSDDVAPGASLTSLFDSN